MTVYLNVHFRMQIIYIYIYDYMSIPDLYAGIFLSPWLHQYGVTLFVSESEPDEGIAMEIQPTLPDVASVGELGVDQEALLLLSAVSPYCC